MESYVEIKCLNCGVWNVGYTHCKSCHLPITREQKQEESKLTNQNNSINKDRKDQFEKSLEKFKNSRFLMVRVCYQLIYSTVWLFWVISSVFSMVVAFLSA